MINQVELLNKIDAALRIAPQDTDESIAYPIIAELRNCHKDFLKTLITQEIEKSAINRVDYLFLESLTEKIYPGKSTKETILTVITVRKQIRKIVGLPP
jgi:hypothetical protein